MIIGTYTHQVQQQELQYKTNITLEISKVDFVVKKVTITGRPPIDSDIYREKENDSKLHVRHVVSVALMTKDLIEKYVNKFTVDMSTTNGNLTNKANSLAEKIFDEFKKRVTDSENLFIGDKNENQGSLDLSKRINLLNKIQVPFKKFKAFQNVFNKKEATDKKIIAFLTQKETGVGLSSLIKDEKEIVTLNIDSWGKLCFLFENTLIDYKGRSVNSQHCKNIKEGQDLIDKLYSNFDTSIRKLFDDEYKRIALSGTLTRFLIPNHNERARAPIKERGENSPADQSKENELKRKSNAISSFKPQKKNKIDCQKPQK